MEEADEQSEGKKNRAWSAGGELERSERVGARLYSLDVCLFSDYNEPSRVCVQDFYPTYLSPQIDY